MVEFLTGNKTASMAARGDDFYASPYAALPPLLVAERRRLPKVLWEPSCGNGAAGAAAAQQRLRCGSNRSARLGMSSQHGVRFLLSRGRHGGVR